MARMLLGPLLKALTSPFELVAHFLFEHWKHHGMEGLLVGAMTLAILGAIFALFVSAK